jgi:hypothetical protein
MGTRTRSNPPDVAYASNDKFGNNLDTLPAEASN